MTDNRKISCFADSRFLDIAEVTEKDLAPWELTCMENCEAGLYEPVIANYGSYATELKRAGLLAASIKGRYDLIEKLLTVKSDDFKTVQGFWLDFAAYTREGFTSAFQKMPGEAQRSLFGHMYELVLHDLQNDRHDRAHLFLKALAQYPKAMPGVFKTWFARSDILSLSAAFKIMPDLLDHRYVAGKMAERQDSLRHRAISNNNPEFYDYMMAYHRIHQPHIKKADVVESDLTEACRYGSPEIITHILNHHAPAGIDFQKILAGIWIGPDTQARFGAFVRFGLTYKDIPEEMQQNDNVKKYPLFQVLKERHEALAHVPDKISDMRLDFAVRDLQENSAAFVHTAALVAIAKSGQFPAFLKKIEAAGIDMNMDYLAVRDRQGNNIIDTLHDRGQVSAVFSQKLWGHRHQDKAAFAAVFTPLLQKTYQDEIERFYEEGHKARIQGILPPAPSMLKRRRRRA